MNLVGKSLQEIQELTKNKSKTQLQRLLYEHASLEQHFTPAEVAAKRRLSKRVVLQKIHTGEIPAHKPIDNGFRISLSAVHAWDANTALALEQEVHGG